MAKKPEITPIDTSFNVVGTLNQNFENIKEAFENTLSLDGSTPNQMQADLDLNGHNLLNARINGLTLQEYILSVVNGN